MRKLSKLLCLLQLLVLLALGAPLPASAADANPHWTLKVVDAVVVRPTTLALSFVSTGLFVGLLPITFPTGIATDATYVMVFAPWRFTAGRDLGEFAEYRDGRTIYGTKR